MSAAPGPRPDGGADLPHITMVAAVADNGVIGHDGGLPWHVPGDLRGFKAATMGKPMVMGRATFDSMGALPGRRSIVLTRDRRWSADGAEVAHSVDEALRLAGDGPFSVVGGQQVFELFLPYADRLRVSRIPCSPEGDTWFPAIDADTWRVTDEEPHDGWTVLTYERTRPRTQVVVAPGAAAGGVVKAGASCAVRDGDRLLLTRRADNGLWCLPGGGVDAGETWAQAARREVREETGLSVRIESVLSAYADPDVAICYPDGRRTQVFGVCFRAGVESGEAGGSDEVTESRWVTREECDRLPIVPLHRPLVQAAFGPADTPAAFA